MKPIEALAEILRKAQGRTCAVSGEDIDIGYEVMRLRDALEWRDKRLAALGNAQTKMREPERKMVCDILANGSTREGPVKC